MRPIKTLISLATTPLRVADRTLGAEPTELDPALLKLVSGAGGEGPYGGWATQKPVKEGGGPTKTCGPYGGWQ